MKKIIQLVTVFLSIVFWSGCDEDSFTPVVEIDIPPHESRLAVSGYLYDTDTVVQLLVRKSLGILASSTVTDTVDAPNVQLQRNGVSLGTFQKSFSFNKGLFDLSQTQGFGNNTELYTCKVSAAGLPNVSATMRMPSRVPIAEMSYVRNGTTDPDGKKRDLLSITFDDAGETSDYYSVKANYQVRDSITKQIGSQGDIYITLQQGVLENNDERFPFLTDATFNGKRIKLNFVSFGLGYSSSNRILETFVTADLTHLSKEDYQYQKSLGFIFDQGNPFSEPVILKGNISNGYGFFGVRSRSSATVKLK